MKKLFLYITFIFSLIFAQSPITYWVDGTNGNNSNDGKSEETAFKTVQKVFDDGLLGNYIDIINVKPGTYDFSVSLIYVYDKEFVMKGTGTAAQTIFNAGAENQHFYISGTHEDSVHFENITFANGSNEYNAGSFNISSASKVYFKNCVFEKNTGGYNGGAVYVSSGSRADFEGCTFNKNSATNRGGAIYIEEGSADNTKTAITTIKNSIFSSNYVKSEKEASGGAICSRRNTDITNSVFTNNYAYANYEKPNNTDFAFGGAIHAEPQYFDKNARTNKGGLITIKNSTFDRNYISSGASSTADMWGGTIAYGSFFQVNPNPKVHMFNSIVTNSEIRNKDVVYTGNNYDNYGTVIGAYYAQYYKFLADYSNIQNGVDKSWAGDNIYDVAAGFKDKANGDYSLSDKSPMIGAGIYEWSDADLIAPNADILGATRPAPEGFAPDLGAYENSNATMSGPMPVSRLTVVAATRAVRLKWSRSTKSLTSNEPAENIKYQIYQGDQNIAQTSDTSYVVTGLTNGETFNFSVSAKNTSTSIESALAGPFAVTPSYLGPWYVATSGGKGQNSGSSDSEYGSESSPINNLSTALEVAAEGDTIIMMVGTHSGVNNRDITISKQVVITGDPKKGPELTIIDAAYKARHFLFGSYNNGNNLEPADTSWVIQNITLYRGKVSGSEYDASGASIRLQNRYSPKFYKVIFHSNRDETTSNNQAGAVYVEGQSVLTAIECQFVNNKSIASEDGSGGGAIRLSSYPESIHTIQNSIFNGNQVVGKYSANGSAIYARDGVNISNSVFYYNTSAATEGPATGAIHFDQPYGYYIKYSTLVNNTFAYNSVTSPNGYPSTSVLYYYDYDDGGHGSGSGGESKHRVYAFNNIIYGNSETNSNGDSQSIRIENSDFKADYNLIQDLDELTNRGEFDSDYSYSFDPIFNDTSNGDFSLSGQSLALGKGIASWEDYILLTAPSKDISGDARPFPKGSSPDLGAYENSLGKSPYPSQVQGLVAKGGSGQVTLSWDALAEADAGYKIYMSTSTFSESEATLIASTLETTHTKTGLDNTKRYYFRVTAINAAEYEGSASSIDISPTFAGPVWWVATNGDDNEGEGSVGDPLASIRKAMEKAASGDTIMLKPGTYTGDGNRNIVYPDYSVENTGTKFFDSLVIRSQKGAVSTIIDAEGSRHFSLESTMSFIDGFNQVNQIDSTFQFIGLTFRGGRKTNAGGSFFIQGGEFFSTSGDGNGDLILAQPKFSNCIFVDNAVGGATSEFESGSGGAIFANSAYPIFDNCIFDNNYATQGGAINFSSRNGNESASQARTIIRNSLFTNNIASNSGSNQGFAPNGGAINVEASLDLIILNSTFRGNSAESSNGGGLVLGGAIHLASSNWNPKLNPGIQIRNSRFTRNAANNGAQGGAIGGAIYAAIPVSIVNSVIDSNLVQIASSFQLGFAGGIALDASPSIIGNTTITGYNYLVNNTIVNNVIMTPDSSGLGAAIVDLNPENHQNIMFNNIIWGNNANSSTKESNSIALLGNLNSIGSSWNSHNNIQDKDVFENYFNYSWGENTTSVDPAFIGGGNYKLSDGSPLIGLGTGSFSFEGQTTEAGPSKDFEGNRRPNPSGSNPDLGAYENALASSPYPDPVENVVATATTRSVALSWDKNSATNIKKYNVYSSTSSQYIKNEATSAGSTEDSTFSVNDLVNGTEYYFWITAIDSSNFEGPVSKTVSAVPMYLGPNWWVDPSVSAFGDGSFNSPLGSIAEAISNVASSGDTIKLKAGTYVESNLFISGSAGMGDPGLGEIKTIESLAIIGVNGPAETIIDAQGNNAHFMLNKLNKIFIRGIKFLGGHSETPGGSIKTLEIDSLIVRNSIFESNNSDQSGGAISLENVRASDFTNVYFFQNTVEITADLSFGFGGAVSAFNQNGEQFNKATFTNCIFEANGIEASSGAVRGGTGGALALSDHTVAEINNSQFKNNFVEASGQAGASVISISGSPILGSADILWSQYPSTKLIGCLIEGNYVKSSILQAVIVETSAPLDVYNNLIINNYALNGIAQVTINTTTGQPDKTGFGIQSKFINNTIYGNSGASNLISSGGSRTAIKLENNIIWANNGGNNESSGFVVDVNFNSTMNTSHNIFEDNIVGDFTETGNINEDPKFKNPGDFNFNVLSRSPAIDAGIENGVILDFRGYYRVGIPDIGALEAGASKYILAIDDDLKTTLDTTFVDRSDTLQFTITTNDIDGNLVSSNESVQWTIFPSAKYVSLITADVTTSGGDATATFKVTQQAKGKGFRFRVEAEVGDATLRSEMYVIEELVTGSPPPVPSLTISPSTWTSSPDFILGWTIPNWSENRDLLGAIIEIDDGINSSDQFFGFPENNPLKSYAFSIPDPGEYTANLRLVDELGNEDPDSSKSVKAYFDNIPPQPFEMYGPDEYEISPGVFEVSYTSDTPRFEWENGGDYPSGIKVWRLYISGNLYGTYTENDVTIDGSIVAVEDTVSLNDGYYEWWVEAEDYAGSITNSDTGSFGVDLSAPLITHDNPLTEIDQNSTTPTINVDFTDQASGVKTGRLHYRRSGTNGGFVTVDLLSGPKSIPGSDIKSQGVEYYIDTEDNIGNYSQWPLDFNGAAVQSVRVVSENSIKTTDQWPAGLPSGIDSSSYVLFSIPFDVGDGLSSITAVMGVPDQYKYRLFGYNGGYIEHSVDNYLPITMGNAYFFIYDDTQSDYTNIPQLAFDFGKGTSTQTSPPFFMNSNPGEWKFFGNPYNFDVNLSEVIVEDGNSIQDVGTIYTWNGPQGWISPGSSIEPWKGYIYKSSTYSDFEIDGTGNVFGKRLAKESIKDQMYNRTLDANEWMVNIAASTGNSRDELNTIGVLNIAEDGYDHLDEFEPPTVPGNISLRIDNRTRIESPDLYAKDIRKPNENGHYWDLQVVTPANGKQTYLAFDGLGYVPQEYEIFLINKTNGQAKSLKWENNYQFANTGPKPNLIQDLRLVIGSRDFVKENNAGVSLYPDAFVLSQNYPNPFNPQTSIMISFEEDARLDLVIYNLLGEEVARLAANEYRPAGYYNFIWNGTNKIGTKVSTGVYFYHAMVRDIKGKVVLNKTRKMVFLK